jgi:hypothetical protein
VADSIESQVAAENMKTVAPSHPGAPVSPPSVSTSQAAGEIMDSVRNAEAAAATVADPGDVVKSIQGTAQEIYGTTPRPKDDDSSNK